ncbi:hypothetical protein EGW08_010360, partial [Elysia chlorotica]
YRKHPFSSIRLSPVSQLAGVQGQTPFGNHQRDDSLRGESKDFFAQNRARNFRRKDPFERPINRASFPLVPVNEGISLDLPANADSSQRPKGLYPTQRKFNDGKEENPALEPVRSNKDPLQAPEFHGASAPEGAFVWAKPVAIPQVGASNASKEDGKASDGADTKASLINVNPGDSLSFPKTKELKLPDLPSVSEKLRDRNNKNNKTLNQNAQNGTSTQNYKTLQNITRKPSNLEFSNENNAESDGSNSVELSLGPEEKLQNKYGNIQPPPRSNKQKPNFNAKEPAGKLTISRPTLVASRGTVSDPKPGNKGRYDVTVFTDEAITKKSGIPLLTGTFPSGESPKSEENNRVSPLDVPAIKTVVERTIEDGSEKIVKNERRLDSDDSGFILTNDLYSDEGNLEDAL